MPFGTRIPKKNFARVAVPVLVLVLAVAAWSVLELWLKFAKRVGHWQPKTFLGHVARVAVMVVTALVLLVLGPLEVLARAFRESRPQSSRDMEDKRR